ncbi:hypothetical protein ACFC18_49935, partial [Streptomyces sp. NPDC056121]
PCRPCPACRARDYSLLDVLSRQHDGEGEHLQMKQVADTVVLSQSTTTRLVARLGTAEAEQALRRRFTRGGPKASRGRRLSGG